VDDPACAPGCIDEDGDGYGEGDDCEGPDCDDGNRRIHPGASEVCDDNRDNDCDGQRDEGCGGGGDLGCWQLYRCLVDCAQDQACATGCQEDADAEALELLQVQEACVGRRCPNGGSDCIFSECADELRECVLDTDEPLGCGDFNVCLITCGQDQRCAGECEAAASRAAVSDFNDLMQCVSENCQGAADVNDCADAECPDQLDTCFGE